MNKRDGAKAKSQPCLSQSTDRFWGAQEKKEMKRHTYAHNKL